MWMVTFSLQEAISFWNQIPFFFFFVVIFVQIAFLIPTSQQSCHHLETWTWRMKKYGNENNTSQAFSTTMAHKLSSTKQFPRFTLSAWHEHSKRNKTRCINGIFKAMWKRRKKKVRHWWISGFYFIGIWHIQSLFFFFFRLVVDSKSLE